MIDRLDKFTVTQRFLLGIGIPLIGGFLLSVLARLGINLAPTEWLIVGEMMLLAGVGAFLCARWWAILVVPLALVAGLMTAFVLEGQDIVWLWIHISGFKSFLTLIIDSALAGAILGVAVAKGVQMFQRMMGDRLSIPQTFEASSQKIPSPAPKTPAVQKTIPEVEAPLQNSVATEPGEQQVAAPEPAVPEQDEIARVVAQMQREYAKAKSNEPDDGNPKTR